MNHKSPNERSRNCSLENEFKKFEFYDQVLFMIRHFDARTLTKLATSNKNRKQKSIFHHHLNKAGRSSSVKENV